MSDTPGPDQRRRSRTYSTIVNILHPLLEFYTEPRWSGSENLPEGGFVAVSNHVTNIDALTFGHFLVDHGVPVKFLAKSELFETPLVGRMLAAADQIRVERGTHDAAKALEEAKAALLRGECVGIFPEGTLTRDPDMWPMKGKTGAARLALETGVPVIPIPQWGTQEAIGRYSVRPKFRRNVPVKVKALPPVDLSDLREQPATAETVREATRRIMADLTAGVAQLRGQTPPERVYDVAVDGDPRPLKRKRKRHRGAGRR
ncbi:MAG: lysophospholipid acyltransferase family protein [Bowdeniella nasicola]|nr:lysophospholipid acyltransferase family protein [Bowdeniella nasicola]